MTLSGNDPIGQIISADISAEIIIGTPIVLNTWTFKI